MSSSARKIRRSRKRLGIVDMLTIAELPDGQLKDDITSTAAALAGYGLPHTTLGMGTTARAEMVREVYGDD